MCVCRVYKNVYVSSFYFCPPKNFLGCPTFQGSFPSCSFDLWSPCAKPREQRLLCFPIRGAQFLGCCRAGCTRSAGGRSASPAQAGDQSPGTVWVGGACWLPGSAWGAPLVLCHVPGILLSLERAPSPRGAPQHTWKVIAPACDRCKGWPGWRMDGWMHTRGGVIGMLPLSSWRLRC